MSFFNKTLFLLLIFAFSNIKTIEVDNDTLIPNPSSHYDVRYNNRHNYIKEKPTLWDTKTMPDVEKEKADALKYIQECNAGIIFPENPNPNITVIFTYHNVGHKIRPSLISLERQDLRKFEIIMIDDASDEEFRVEHFLDDIQERDKRFRFYRNNERKGLLYSRKLGIEKAKGKYILFIDQEDLISFDDSFDILFDQALEYDADVLEFQFYYGDKNSFDNINMVQIDEKFPSIRKLDKSEIRNLKDFALFGIEGRNFNLFGKFIKTEFLQEVVKKMDQSLFTKRFEEIDDYIYMYHILNSAENYVEIDAFCYFKHISEADIVKEDVPQHQKEVIFLIKYLLKLKLYNAVMESFSTLVYTDNYLENIQDRNIKSEMKALCKDVLELPEFPDNEKRTLKDYYNKL